MKGISPKRARKARKIRTKLRTEIVEQYVARRAGRDDAPKWDASNRQDDNNTTQQHVLNSAPIRQIAENAERQRNRED